VRDINRPAICVCHATLTDRPSSSASSRAQSSHPIRWNCSIPLRQIDERLAPADRIAAVGSAGTSRCAASYSAIRSASTRVCTAIRIMGAFPSRTSGVSASPGHPPDIALP